MVAESVHSMTFADSVMSSAKNVPMDICRTWNDITCWLLLAMSIWALYFYEIEATWLDAPCPMVDISCLVAGIVTGTAALLELCAVFIEFSPKKLSPAVKGDDSKTMLLVYSCLSVSYFKMGVSGNTWVHTDPLAFGGPRPVYTLRYLEWSICMPLLISLSSSPPMESSTHQPKEDEGEGEDDDQSKELIEAQVDDVLSLPRVVCSRLYQTELRGSARCTAVYIWSSWIALVVKDEFVRWLLLCASFSAYAVATTEQIVYWFGAREKDERKQSRDYPVLVITQAALATHYGVIYLLAVFGCISWQNEQMSYTVSDVVAKLTHSAILVSMRRRRNLMILDELRVAAQLAAMDIQRLISQANVPIFCVNKNLEVEEWNQKIEELTGVKKVDALQRSLPEFCSERASGWWASAEKLLRDALEGLDSSVVEMHMTGAPQNGQMAKSCMMAVSATSQRTRTGEIKGAVCIGQDVTELTSEKQKAENLAESLNRLIQSANAPIFEIDLEFNVIKWNSWLENRSALSQEELAGKSVFEVLSPETRKSLQDGVERALTAEQTPNDVFEVRLHNSMGQGTATLLLTATTCLAPTGQTSGVICIGQDITKLKDLDERKASMMAVVSHELKSPLHGILGLCNSLLEDDETPFQVKKPLSMMNSCTKRLLDMVSNIMDASVLVHDQKMRMSKDPVQIQTVVEEVITLSQQSSGEVGSHALSPGVHLINEVFAPLPVIEADRYRVTQMLYNLVTNAIKFTHKGSIIVSASADDERKMVKVDVRDTGIGIAQENIDRIFQPFDQEDSSDSRRYGGLGLGLSICREVAARHGGEISVESVRGQGSTFSVVLPYKMHSVSQEDQEESQIEGSTTSAPVPAERALTDNLSDKERTGFAARFNRAERSEKGQCASSDQGRFATVDLLQQQLKRLTPTDLLAVDNARPTILSVDDDPIHLQITHNMLVSQDYEVREAMNVAEAAADMVRKGIPSLILLDVMMPEMMGTELVKALRQNFGPELLPIVMVSAKGNKDTITSCLEMGANDYVQKPFQKKELLERIRFQLKLSGKARQTQKVNKRMEEENKTSESQGSLLNWKDINAKELRAAHEERDKAQQEASDLRRRVLELEELHRPHREEQKRLTQEFLKRQQVLLAHQEQLAACMEQLESFQAVQRSLLLVTDKATDPKVPLHLSTPLAVFAGHFTEGPVNESLRDVQTAEESLKCCLNRMIELSNSLLPGDAKEEMNSIVAVLNQDMSKVIMETGRKHYMLLDAQCKLQDQALQIQRILQPPRVVQQPRMSSHG